MFRNKIRKFRSSILFTFIFGGAYLIITILFKILGLEPNYFPEIMNAVMFGGFIFGWLVDFHEPDYRNKA